MYEDKRKKIQINWKSLLIKLAILLVVVFLIILIVSLVNRDKKVESNFEANFKAMRSAATEYFTGSRLPQDLNESVSISLQDMFREDLLVEFFDQNGNSCDTNESYAEATKISDTKYRIEIRLVCDNESDTAINTVEYEATDPDLSDTEENLDDDSELEEPPVDNPSDDNETEDNTTSDTNNNDNNNNSHNQSSSSTIAVTHVLLNYKRIVVDVGATRSVKAYVYPNNATNKTVSWSSSDTSIATVNGGIITGHKAGKATVSAVVGGKSTTVEVVVVDKNNNINHVNTCSYGSNEYYVNLYTLAYKVEGNCAVSYASISGKYANEASRVGIQEYQKLVQEMLEVEKQMGVDLEVESPEFKEVPNTSGTGYVGYQIFFTVREKISTYGSKTVYAYFLDQNGNRKVVIDDIH